MSPTPYCTRTLCTHNRSYHRSKLNLEVSWCWLALSLGPVAPLAVALACPSASYCLGLVGQGPWKTPRTPVRPPPAEHPHQPPGQLLRPQNLHRAARDPWYAYNRAALAAKTIQDLVLQRTLLAPGLLEYLHWAICSVSPSSSSSSSSSSMTPFGEKRVKTAEQAKRKSFLLRLVAQVEEQVFGSGPITRFSSSQVTMATPSRKRELQNRCKVTRDRRQQKKALSPN
ncbi:hypothetical protein NQZ68_013231 [Dissostichus eleginoides]|nr:hypothetical protein NQZ68_013231 [Dissostichus eleginoides]